MQTLKKDALGQGPGQPGSSRYVQSQCGVSRNLTNLLSSYLRALRLPFWGQDQSQSWKWGQDCMWDQEAPVTRSGGNWHREARSAGSVCTYMLSFVKHETEGLFFLGVA